MPIAQTDVVVGGETLKIQSLPASKGAWLFAKLVKIAGGAGKGLHDLASSGDGQDEISRSYDLGAMLTGILDQIEPEDFQRLMQSIVKDSVVRTGSVSFEDWYESRFSRKYDDLMVLVMEILEYNYGGLLALAKKLFKDVQPQLESLGLQTSQDSSKG